MKRHSDQFPFQATGAGAHEGEIKCFLSQKGYGFIISSDFEGDIYFQRRNLPLELQDGTIELKGQACTFDTFDTQDGKIKAANVKVMGLEELVAVGVVKSYVAKSQYGFIASPSVDGDVYFKAKELMGNAWQQDLKGCTVRFQPVAMPDGKFQAKNVTVLESQTGMQPQGMPLVSAPMPHMAAPMPMMAAPMSQMAGPPRMAAPPPMRAPGPGAAPVAFAPAVGHMLGDGSQMVGQVKSFDPAKGYGFITPPNFPTDVYFKSTMDGIHKGLEVTFTLQYAPDGRPQAINVARPFSPGEVLVGTVRSYNPNKGFGFLAVEGHQQDVYFQKPLLPMECQEQSSLDGAQFSFIVNLKGGSKPQAQDMQLMMPPSSAAVMPSSKRPFSPGGGPMGASSFSVKRFRTEAPMTNGAPAPAPGLAPRRGSLAQAMGAPVMAPAAQMGGQRHGGSVKSYNPQKGFGFIFCPALSCDVYLNARNLPEPARGMQLDQRQVSFTVRYTADGKAQANDVQVESW